MSKETGCMTVGAGAVRRLLSLALLLGIAGCMVAPKPGDQQAAGPRVLVYPAPPDEARFVFERSIYGNADVEAQAEDSYLKNLLTGASEINQGMKKPYALAVHQGRIFVSDTADHSVRVFDVPNQKVFRIGNEDGDGQIAKPLGLDTDRAGNLYVADATAKAILVYNRDGKFLRKIAGPKMFDRLSSVTVDPSGERIYTVDIGGVSSEQHRVRVFDAKSGAHLFDFGKRGNGPGELNLPRDVAIGKDGRLYVVDGGNFRVQIFDRDGKFLKSFGEIGKQAGSFARPKEVATDSAGNVYVADTAFGNFQIFSPDGELLMFIGERSEQDGPARYMLPSGIAVDEDGRIYFVDQWFKRLDVFRPAGLKASDGFLGQRPKPRQEKK